MMTAPRKGRAEPTTPALFATHLLLATERMEFDARSTSFPEYTSAMDNERIRAICMALPHAAETLNWGHHLVYWAGDRDIGGKMFAMTDLDGTGFGVLWFHCGAERFHELLEVDGISASPHLARAHWVTLERWDVLRPRQIEEELRRAHELIFARLPKRTKTLLAMPEKEQLKLIRERKKVLAARGDGRTSKVKAGKVKPSR